MNEEIIRKTQKLAKIVLSEDRYNIIKDNLTNILDYMKVINELDVHKYPSTYNASGLSNITSKDIPNLHLCIEQNAALKNASEKSNGYIIVPRVIKN